MERKFSTTEEKVFIADLAFPDYKDLQEARQLVDDCLAGQNTIKSKEKYLPPNDWQKEHPDQYEAFLRRALFPGETSYALDIYRGLFSLGNPRINLPANGRLDYLVNRASVFGDGLKAVQKRLNTEQMSHGLRCMLVGVTADIDRPFFIQEYAADKFLRSHFRWDGNESIADFVLLNESTERYDLTDFKDVADYRLRILALDKDGFYYQREIAPHELKSGKLDILNPPLDDRTVYPSVNAIHYLEADVRLAGVVGAAKRRRNAPRSQHIGSFIFRRRIFAESSSRVA